MRILQSMRSRKSGDPAVDSIKQLAWLDEEKELINRLIQVIIGKAFGMLFLYAFICGGSAVLFLTADVPILRFTGLAFAVLVGVLIKVKLVKAFHHDLYHWLIDWYNVRDPLDAEESEEADGSEEDRVS